MTSPALLDDPSDDEIDLGEYVRTVIRHWRMVVGLAVVAALAALGVSFLQPRVYEARAMVAITKPQYVMNFDPRIGSSADLAPPAKALTGLATSDDVLAALASSPAGASLPAGAQSADALRKMLTAEATADPSLVALRVRAEDPEKAAALANAWAEALVTRARDVYGQGQGDVTYFEARLAEADQSLAKAEADLAAFQARSELSVLKARLSALQDDQKAYLAEQQAIARLMVDVEGLRKKVAAYPPDADVAVGDDLTALLLEIKAFGAQTTTSVQTTTSAQTTPSGQTTTSVQTASPIQLQLGSAEVSSSKRAGDLQKSLASLSENLSAKSSATQARLGEITPQILKLQGQVQQLENESGRLTLARDLAKETYQTIARKAEEARIAAQASRGQVAIASQASPPSEPASSRRLLTVAVASVLGLLVGIIGAFGLEWWRREMRGEVLEQPSARPASGATVGG